LSTVGCGDLARDLVDGSSSTVVRVPRTDRSSEVMRSIAFATSAVNHHGRAFPTFGAFFAY